MFNEDKRTDLIGECWVELESVLQRGGGQNDGWHDLNSKGRYAGQIRIELTFYDTRPKEQPQTVTADESAALDEDEAQGRSSRTVGPRQPQVKRRPLPSTTVTPQPPSSQPRMNSAPMSHPAARKSNALAHPDERRYSDPAAQYNSSSQDFAYPPSHAPDMRMEMHQNSATEPHYHQTLQPDLKNDEYYHAGEVFAQDPSEYRALPVHNQLHQESAYRDDATLVDAFDDTEGYDDNYGIQSNGLSPNSGHSRDSYAASQRPTPPVAPPHAHSAPVLAPHEHFPPDQNFTAMTMRQHGYYHSPEQQYPSPPHQHDMMTEQQAPPPPPPPTHRNSMPAVSRPPPNQLPMQMSSGPRRALHHATNSDDVRTGQEQDMHLPNYPSQTPDYGGSLGSDRRRSSTAIHAHEAPLNPQTGTQHGSYDCSRPTAANGIPIPATATTQPLSIAPRPRPQSSVEVLSSRTAAQQPQASISASSVPIVRPRPISPNAPANGAPTAARKSVGSSVSLPAAPHSEPHGEEPAGMPFSPDSFAQFNPHIQNGALPTSKSSPFDHSNGIQPMYGNGSQLSERPEQDAANSEAPRIDSFGRIVRSDGRRVDPSDHLPSSTYAPEPELKGVDKEKRANIKVNVKTRFGPRDATPPRSPQSISPGGAAGTSSPPPPSSSPQPTRTPPSHVMGQPRQTPRSQPSLSNLRYTPPTRQGAHTPSPLPASSPLQSVEKTGRSRLQKRHTPSSSPLAPSQPTALNQASYYHSSYSTGAPPVPSKIPLDDFSEPQHNVGMPDQDMPHDYRPRPAESIPPAIAPVSSVPVQQPRRHGYAASGGYQVQPGTSPNLALSHEISQIDLGPTPSQAIAAAESEPKYGGLAGGRLRRSRFGA